MTMQNATGERSTMTIGDEGSAMTIGDDGSAMTDVKEKRIGEREQR